MFYLFIQDRLGFIVNRVSLKLGEISYSLYMNHYLIGAQFLLLGFFFKGFSKMSSIIMTLTIVILVSLSLNRFVEKPSLH